MTTIYIMRHAEASFRANTDQQRTLTATGIQQSKLQAHWLLNQVNKFDFIAVSPFIRTQQTFAEIQQLFLQEKKIDLNNVKQIWDELVPSGNANAVINKLEVFPTTKTLLISHLPLVDEIVEGLIDDYSTIRFSPATIAKIELEDEHWCLKHVQTVNI